MVSVETVGLCTRNVRSKEDRPIFSVPVARATAHRGGDGDGVWSSPQQCIEERERDIEGGEVERGVGYDGRRKMWGNGWSGVSP